MATQAERTAKTTERLLDATIDVLVRRGYSGTSTAEVCRRAKSSRGAQLHHYPTKESLVAAAVEHLVTARMKEIGARIVSAQGGRPALEDMASLLLEVYAGDTFYAWLELVVAARTDAKLRRVLQQMDKRITREAERLCREFLMPDASDEKVSATTRLILSIFDGLAVHRILSGSEEPARKALARAARAGLFSVKGAAA
ncbi:MAG: TetR/AcrR family transcriptional regulator [Myxococcaceae bacterium]